MEWWQAVILGIVEGLTEYLPVSSTGHLLLAQRLMGIPQSESADAYAVCIQAGAILAVVGLYWKRMAQMARGLLGKDAQGLRLGLRLLLAFVMTTACYLAAEKIFEKTLNKDVKEVLFNIPCITAAWLVGGVAILGIVYLKPKRQDEMNRRAGELETLTWRGAALIGMMQAIAIWPGTSRSLITLVGGLLVGLSLPAAVEFTFLLGVVTLLAATAKDGKEFGPLMLQTYSPATMLLGVAVAALSAAIAVKWMVGYLRRHSLAIFGWYRVILAAVVGAMLLMGWVK